MQDELKLAHDLQFSKRETAKAVENLQNLHKSSDIVWLGSRKAGGSKPPAFANNLLFSNDLRLWVHANLAAHPLVDGTAILHQSRVRRHPLVALATAQLAGRSLRPRLVPEYMETLGTEPALEGQRFDRLQIGRDEETGETTFRVTSRAVDVALAAESESSAP